MLKHPRQPCWLRNLQDIIKDYRKIWLKRNRPGGLADSIRRFQTMLEEYRARLTAGH